MLKKVSNPFVESLKGELVKRFQNVQIEVNPRSAWVKGEVPQNVQDVLKAAGFVVCSKGWYFTHECVKMPAFPTVQAVQAPKPETVKAPKVEKTFAELDENVKTRVITHYLNAFPGCQIEVKGTWVYVSGEKTRDYKDALKESGLHWGFKIKAWSGPIPESVLNEQTEQGEGNASPETAAEVAEDTTEEHAENVKELTELSEIVIRARKGEITREQMISLMKEACPF